MYDFRIFHSNDFNAISKTMHVIVFGTVLGWSGTWGELPEPRTPAGECKTGPFSITAAEGSRQRLRKAAEKKHLSEDNDKKGALSSVLFRDNL